MDIKTITLADFSKIASMAGDDNAKIKVSGDTLKSTKLPVWASTNHKSMSVFLDTIKKELGPAVADMASAQLHAKLGEDKPLTVRAVRETLEDIVRLTQKNLNVRDKFLSGIDPQHSFDESFVRMADEYGFKGKLSDSAMASLKNAVKEDFLQHFSLVSAQGGNLQKMEEFASKRCSLTACIRNFTETGMSKAYGALDADVVSLAKLLKISSCYSGVLLQSLQQMRQIQPEGELTAETVWKTLFNEPLPKNMEAGGAFCEAVDNAVAEKWVQAAPGKGKALALLCAEMPLKNAREVLVRRNMTMDDLPFPEKSLKMSNSSNYSGEQLMARDVCRRMRETVAGADKQKISTPSELNVAGQTFVLGKDIDFAFVSEDDKDNYAHGKPSSYSAKIMAAFREACGGETADPKQVQMLAYLSSQAPMRQILGTGGGGIGSVLDLNIIEHSATKISFVRMENGSVRVHISTFDLPDAVRYSGYASLTYDVSPKGEAVPVAMQIQSKFGETAEMLASQIQDFSLSDEDLRYNINIAQNGGTVSAREAELLLQRVDARSLQTQELQDAAASKAERASESEEVQSAQDDPVQQARELALRETSVPQIHNQKELFAFLKGLSKGEHYGKSEKIGEQAAFDGTQKPVHSFTGLVFRGDSRLPNDIMRMGGFSSKNDLNDPHFLQEAQGIGETLGATGTSGVSCAKELEYCIPYSNSGSRSGYIYVIDTAKLGEDRQAYDMEAVSYDHKDRDETGREVNVTQIPPHAVIGWIAVSDVDKVLSHSRDDNGAAYLLENLSSGKVTFNGDYRA